jgi:taurine dioxygenase
MGEPLEFRRLSEHTGAEVIGFDFDFDAPADAARTHAWHEALDTYQLLLFRGVEIDADRQVALVETLGPALIENDIGRAYQFVSNVHEEGILGDEAFAFHSDHAFMTDPIEVISLYGLEIPTSGTCTRFANGIAAARALPEDLRERIEGLRARHIIDPGAESGVVPVRGPRLPDDLPHAYHPILMPHVRSGEPILYLCEQQTDEIEGLEREESRELIEALFTHLYSPRFLLTHDWQPGDLLVWDNRALQHARDAVAPGTGRTLRRVSVGGTSVYEFFAA